MYFKFITKGNYYYELIEDVTIYSPLLKGYEYSNDIMSIQNGKIKILKGYAWNGASPKFTFLDVVWGSPDGVGKKTLKATLVHDCLYQFQKEIGISRIVCDKILLFLLNDFKLKFMYYYLVRLFGWLRW